MNTIKLAYKQNVLTSLLLLLGQVAPDIARHDMIKDFHNDKISSRLEASNMDYKMLTPYLMHCLYGVQVRSHV